MVKWFAIQIFHYAEALIKLYRETKGRLLPEEQMLERFEICKTCDHFDGRSCKLCGCCTNRKQNHFNKLAFPSESCPDNPPRWKEVPHDPASTN